MGGSGGSAGEAQSQFLPIKNDMRGKTVYRTLGSAVGPFVCFTGTVMSLNEA